MYRFSISVLASSGLLVALGACSAAAQSGLDSMLRQLGERAIEEIVRPDPPPVTAPSTTTQRSLASATDADPTKAEVLEAQQLLVQLGYEPGLPDGLMGPNTASAISAFQADAERPQTGTVTNALIARLRSAAADPSGVRTAAQRVVQPSFDCARAGTPTEFAICGTPELARLDRKMAETFSHALASASDPARIRAEQRTWVDARNGCGSNVACLETSMSSRIATLGGRTAAQRADVPDEVPPSTGADALPFDKDVYLIRFGQDRTRSPNSAVVQYSTENLDSSDTEALVGAIEDAISARPIFAGLRTDAASLASGALTFEAYALVAGDWRSRIVYAIESSYPDVEFSVIQIAQGAGTAPMDDRTGGAPATLPVANFEADDRPILRAWLAHYLDRTTDAEQIEVIEDYIGRLQGTRDYSANLVFGEGEIEDRQAGFLARDVHGRWREALAAQILEPPFEMHVRGEVRNLDYDHETDELALFSDYETPRSYFQSISHTILQADIIESGGLSRSDDNLGVRPPSFPKIGLDRELPTRFPMTPARVEEMIANRDIIVYDVALSVTNVHERENERGEHRLFIDTEVLGVSVMTNAGEKIAAFSADDMPRLAPPSEAPVAAEPTYRTVHLARPRDILAAAAERADADTAEVIGSVYPPTSLDSFERRDDIAALAGSAEEIDLGEFWMSGYGALGDYDPETGKYEFAYVVLTYPDSVDGNEDRISRNDMFRLANVTEGSGVRFEMSEPEARRLRDIMGGSDATFRARLGIQPKASADGTPQLPLTANLLEIVALEPESDPALLNEEKVVARIELNPMPNAAADGTGSAPDSGHAADDVSAGAYDILGVRVGQPLEEALALVKPEFAPDRVLHGRREIWMNENLSPQIEATTPLAESIILIGNGDRDLLAIFYEPLVPNDPITGIARTVTFAEGARPAPEAAWTLLTEKYGKIARDNATSALWSRARKATVPELHGEKSVGDLIEQSTQEQNRKTQLWVCDKEMQTMVMSLDYAIQSSRRTGYPAFDTNYPLVDDAGARVPHPQPLPLWPLDLDGFANGKCDTHIVVAGIRQDEDGLVEVLRVVLTHRGYLAAIEQKAKSVLSETTSTGQAAPEIEF